MQNRTVAALATRLGLGVFAVAAFSSHGRTTEPMEWTQFRGPRGDGVSQLAAHPLQWSEEANIRWKAKIEGVAWSQPIVSGGRVFVTTAFANDQPTPQIGESGPGFSLFSREGISRSFGGGSPPDTTYQWRLVCLELDTGRRRWETLVREAQPTIPTHRSNSYASETPATDGDHIYVYVAMAGVYCFDMEGRQIWHQPLDAYAMQFGWGAGSSPLLHGDTLYVLCDNEQESYLVALDKSNGRQRWRVARDESSNWSTPYLWRNRVRSELVTCGGRKTRAYDPATGTLLWELDANGRCATTAVDDDALLYVGSVSRSMGRSGALTAIRAGAAGDLSKFQQDANLDDGFVVWSLNRTAPELSSPLLYDGVLYTLRQHGGIISCFDAKSGTRLYQERLPNAGGFTASPWAVGGRVFCLDEVGNTFVLAAGREFKLVATNALNGMFWSSTAVADGAPLVRSTDHLYCISAQ